MCDITSLHSQCVRREEGEGGKGKVGGEERGGRGREEGEEQGL